jgi:hypothetical protein
MATADVVRLDQKRIVRNSGAKPKTFEVVNPKTPEVIQSSCAEAHMKTSSLSKRGHEICGII